MVPFAGFLMPIQYPSGIRNEYKIVRNNVGMFDVSHMGQFEFSGKNAKIFLDRITTNNLSRLYNGRAQYSALCSKDGGIIDDIILYQFKKKYFMVVNASNIDKNWNWIHDNLINDVKIKNNSDYYSILAVQGPKSRNILEQIFPSVKEIKYYHAQEIEYNGKNLILSRTGYTGELGFEIYACKRNIRLLWDKFINMGVFPCGLGIRDLLRIEMKYCLYGNDIDEKNNPLEAGLDWITNLDKNFIGKEKLMELKNYGLSKLLVAIKLNQKGIPRKGYKVFHGNKNIGLITSGTQSIGLKCGIGLGYVLYGYHKIGTKIAVEIRDKKVEAEIIKPPFLKNTSLHD